MRTATADCPKHMVFGPCGGVRADGGCEVPGLPCSFLGEPIRRWTPADGLPDGPDRLRASSGARGAAAGALAAAIDAGGVVTAGLPPATADVDGLLRAADRLGPVLTAAVAGDPTGAGPSLAPTHRAAVLLGAGLPVIAGVQCRDRNRVAIEGELAAYADLGVSAVLAMTGDHPVSTPRPDAAAVFDLDSTRVAALAARAGHLVAVAEQPAAPPTALRAGRLREKAAAGAEVCFVDVCGGVEPVAAFADRLRADGVRIPLIAVVPLVTSIAAAERLAGSPGVVLPDGFLAGLAAGPDPVATGIARAVAMAEALGAIDGVAGVHLAMADVEDGQDPVDVLAAVAARLRRGAS